MEKMIASVGRIDQTYKIFNFTPPGVPHVRTAKLAANIDTEIWINVCVWSGKAEQGKFEWMPIVRDSVVDSISTCKLSAFYDTVDKLKHLTVSRHFHLKTGGGGGPFSDLYIWSLNSGLAGGSTS